VTAADGRTFRFDTRDPLGRPATALALDFDPETSQPLTFTACSNLLLVSGRTGLALAAIAFGVTPSFGIAVRAPSDAHVAGQAPECRVGAEPTQPYGERPPETFLRYVTRPVVIACATLPSGRRFELVGYQLGRGQRSSLCIDQYDFSTGVGSGCGSNVVRGGGHIDAGSVTRGATGPAVVSGTLSGSVGRVVVRSEVGGRLRRHGVALVRIRDRAVLDAIRVGRPFGRYVAEVPPRARAVTADAVRPRRGSLGLAFFEGFRSAIGEARACYTRPRVARLRLLEPARVGSINRLHVIASYPAGYVTSVDVNIGGKSRIHADLAPTSSPREGGRRVVTLPVRFTRRGATGIDVTAEGVPLSGRCGERPVLRTSSPKTLVVHPE
jgi:hypothetical protein